MPRISYIAGMAIEADVIRTRINGRDDEAETFDERPCRAGRDDADKGEAFDAFWLLVGHAAGSGSQESGS